MRTRHVCALQSEVSTHSQPSVVGMITVFVIDVRFRNIFRITKMLFAFCRHRACAAPENKLVRTVNHWHTLENTPWLSGPLTMLELASESAASALAAVAAEPAPALAPASAPAPVKRGCNMFVVDQGVCTVVVFALVVRDCSWCVLL